jgi:hypothetical protein
MVGLFPSDEMSARGLRSTNSARVFTVYTRDGTNIFVLPNNLRDFENNLLFISILKAATLKGYTLETSIQEGVPEKILKTEDADFAAGYVYAASQETIGTYVTATSKFAKGQQAYQRSCIDRHHRSKKHLKCDGDSKLTDRFSKMKSFTKDYWSMRTSILNLFKSIRKLVPGELVSFLKSSQELEKMIHTSIDWQNRGVFRAEEVLYLNELHEDSLSLLNNFRDRIRNPNERLATHFTEDYTVVRTSLKAAEAQTGTIMNRRAAVLFKANAKKKADVEWNKLKLLEKIASFEDPAKVAHFIPSSLPGIKCTRTQINVMLPLPDTELFTVFDDDDDDHAHDVITSWNAYLGQVRTD